MALLTASRAAARHGRLGGLLAATRCLIVLVCLAALIAPAAAADPPASKEYQVKAAFLFNFAKFVEWPQAAFVDSDAPITIGVIGDDPFGGSLDDMVKGESVRGRSLVVRRAARIEDLKGCQLIYIGRSEKERRTQILAAIGDEPALTVSDLDGFCDGGGIIQFFLDGNKVRFLINQPVALHRGLKMSAQLLSVGKVLGADDLDRRR